MITTIKLRDVRNGEIDLVNIDSIQLLDARDRIALEFMKVLVANAGSAYPGTQARAAFALADQFIASANEKEKEDD